MSVRGLILYKLKNWGVASPLIKSSKLCNSNVGIFIVVLATRLKIKELKVYISFVCFVYLGIFTIGKFFTKDITVFKKVLISNLFYSLFFSF